MTIPHGWLIRFLRTVLLCLVLTGAATAAGLVVKWRQSPTGAGPPDSVNGVSGTATAIAASTTSSSVHSCAIQAGTGKVVCWGSNTWGEATPPASVNGASGTPDRGNLHPIPEPFVILLLIGRKYLPWHTLSTMESSMRLLRNEGL